MTKLTRTMERTSMIPGAGPRLETARRLTLRLFLLLAVAITPAMIGCDDDDDGFTDPTGPLDTTPPAIPTGVDSITGDGEVIVYWTPNLEADLAGYDLYVNPGNLVDEDGFEIWNFVAEIGWDEAYDEGPTDDFADDVIFYRHAPVQNGLEYSYAVRAFDESDNVSELSLNIVVDVPRPQGQSLITYRESDPTSAGFDLSGGVAVDWDDATADFYATRDNEGVVRFVVDPAFVRIHDAGYRAFDDVSFAVQDLIAYSDVHSVEAIVGHTYILRIAQAANDFGRSTDRYAKISIEILGQDLDPTLIGPDDVIFTWGYQEVPGEPQLRPDEPRDGGGAGTPQDLGGVR